ncbi:hypothetical protein B296_00042508 [Ensete ventricosum]|uniref:Uncharacterized protein n=1 Tax=Ensete ventricosum TaxID=4639 RepID=A0A426YBB3_ENSVE|nr:hypothetical protein B296_00042508 [Ensete ventricosum]
MALRSLDNALCTTVEQRPKKVAKVAATPPAAKSSDVHTNNENTPPPAPPVDQSVEYVASEDLKPLADPDTRMEVCMYFSGFWTSVRFDSVISVLTSTSSVYIISNLAKFRYLSHHRPMGF